MEFARINSLNLSNCGVDRAGPHAIERQRKKLLTIFGHLAQSLKLFLEAAKSLADTSPGDEEIAQRLSDPLVRRSTYKKVRIQADFCMKDLMFLNAMVDDEHIASRFQMIKRYVRKITKALDGMLQNIEAMEKSTELRSTIPSQVRLILDLSTIDTEEHLQQLTPLKEHLNRMLAVCNIRSEEEFNVAMASGAHVFKISPSKMEDLLEVERPIGQFEQRPRFQSKGGKRKRSDEAVYQMQTRDSDVIQLEKKMRQTVPEHLKKMKGFTSSNSNTEHCSEPTQIIFLSKGTSPLNSVIARVPVSKLNGTQLSNDSISTAQTQIEPTHHLISETCVEIDSSEKRLSQISDAVMEDGVQSSCDQNCFVEHVQKESEHEGLDRTCLAQGLQIDFAPTYKERFSNLDLLEKTKPLSLSDIKQNGVNNPSTGNSFKPNRVELGSQIRSSVEKTESFIIVSSEEVTKPVNPNAVNQKKRKSLDELILQCKITKANEKPKRTCIIIDDVCSKPLAPSRKAGKSQQSSHKSNVPETKGKNPSDVLARVKRALAKDRPSKKDKKGPSRTTAFTRVRKQFANLLEIKARVTSRRMKG